MTVDAQAAGKAQPSSLDLGHILTTLLILLLGTVFMLLGGAGTTPGEQSIFTDQKLGTLFTLPSQATLYTIGAFCFLVAGLRLFRALKAWLIGFPGSLLRLVWMGFTSGPFTLLLGLFLTPVGIRYTNAASYSIGVSLTIIGAGLLLRDLVQEGRPGRHGSGTTLLLLRRRRQRLRRRAQPPG